MFYEMKIDQDLTFHTYIKQTFLKYFKSLIYILPKTSFTGSD